MNGNFFLQILLQNLSYFFVLTQGNAFLKGLILRQQEEHRLSFERFQYFNFEKKLKLENETFFKKLKYCFFIESTKIEQATQNCPVRSPCYDKYGKYKIDLSQKTDFCK